MQGWYNFIAYWIKLALENKPIPIYGSGEQVRDYTYVVDTAEAYVHAIEKEEAVGEVFLLPTGRGITLNELADLVIRFTDSSAGKIYYERRKGDIDRFVGSYEKAKRILGWKPSIKIEDGLREVGLRITYLIPNSSRYILQSISP